MLNNLISKIQKDKKYTFITASILCVVFLWFNIGITRIDSWGFIGSSQRLASLGLILVYWFIGGVWLAGILRRTAGLNKQWSIISGLFLMLYLISFAMAFWIVIWKITVELMVVSLVGLSLVISVLCRRVIEVEPLVIRDEFSKTGEELRRGAVNNSQQIEIKKRIWVFLAIATIIAIAFLFLARTGGYILTPWEVIQPIYIYLYILISFLVFLIIFSRYKFRTILVVIILHSFLLHSYLPIVYKTGFEGDKWRHLASERWLQDGRVYSPSLFGEPLRAKKIGPLLIPEVFIVGNKTSYANQWGLTIALSWILGIDVFWVDMFLVFIMWSILVPVFLFRLGQFFFKDKRFLGILAFTPALFYPMQVYGAITIPVAFGFLYFVYVFILWLKYLNKDEDDANKNFLWLLLILTALMYFNYLVYFILILEIGLAIAIFRKTLSLPRFSRWRLRLAILFFGTSFCLLFVIPTLDKAVGLSNFKMKELFSFWLLPNQLGEFILGKLLGFAEFIPLPIFISQGNFILMQISKNGLLRAALFEFISWQIWVSLFIWFFITYGLVKMARTKPRRLKFIWILFFIILLLNHFISMYYMEGVRLLSKRLDLAISFFALPLLAFGIYKLIFSKLTGIKVKARIVALGLVVAVSSGLAYASGPKLEVVTQAELKASEYIWSDWSQKNKKTAAEAKNSRSPKNNYCVLANTWPLLALEATSRRNIVAGGFPIYTEYAQPERVQLWKKMTADPSIRYLEKSLAVTGSNFCYFMVEKKWLGAEDKTQDEKLKQLFAMFEEYQKFGEVYVFYYDRGKE